MERCGVVFWNLKKEEEEEEEDEEVKEEEEEKRDGGRAKNYKRFGERVEEVKVFREGHGRLPRQASSGVPKEEGSLGEFLQTQKQSLRKGTLSQERMALLAQIPGVTDYLQNEVEYQKKRFEERVEEVKVFREGHGRLPRQAKKGVPKEEGSLGMFLHHQKQYLKKGTLSQERMALLAQIPGVTEYLENEVETKSFEERVEEVKAFREASGRLPRAADRGVPKEEGTLGTFLYTQKHYLKKGTLSQERMALLSQIPGVTQFLENEGEYQKKSFEERVEEVKAFREASGRLPRAADRGVPKEEGSLGTFLKHQKQYLKKGTLSRERQTLLRRIPGVSARLGLEQHPSPSPEPIWRPRKRPRRRK